MSKFRKKNGIIPETSWLRFMLFLLVMLSALTTFVVLLFLIAYILIKGVPNLKPSLFAWKYTTDNAIYAAGHHQYD